MKETAIEYVEALQTSELPRIDEKINKSITKNKKNGYELNGHYLLFADEHYVTFIAFNHNIKGHFFHHVHETATKVINNPNPFRLADELNSLIQTMAEKRFYMIDLQIIHCPIGFIATSIFKFSNFCT